MNTPVDDGKVQVPTPTTSRNGWRIWSIFVVLCLLSCMSAIDSTIITTSLPTITRDIGGAEKYVWIANAYLFSSTVTQPLYGQVSNIFGRRNPMLLAIALFALGSGLAGGSKNANALIASRTVQGLGTGGLYVLSDITICDILPPRRRGSYLSAVLGTAAFGSTIGPIIGGSLANVNWRWIFWINIPISSFGFIVILLLLNVKYRKSPTWISALARVDYLGNAIFIPSMVSIFLGLVRGGINAPWSSWRIIVPLVLGVIGLIGFFVHQASPICKDPSMPPRLFTTRTSAAGYLIIFAGALVFQAIAYFLPVYFQAVKQASPLDSGVYFLPLAISVIPFGGIAGAFMSRTGLYIPLHLAGFILNAVAVGLFSTLDESSGAGKWIGFQFLAAAGTAFIFTATLPSTLAPLAESDVAVATAAYSWIRSLGLAWGATMASIIFNGQINSHLYMIANASARATLDDGSAYSLVSSSFIESLDPSTRQSVTRVYSESLRIVWIVFAAVSCLGFLFTFIEKHVELKESHVTEFGFDHQEGKEDNPETTVVTDKRVQHIEP